MADWANLKVVDLKAELKRRGLAQAGLKAELIARLEAADKDAEPAQEQSELAEEPAEPEIEPREAPAAGAKEKIQPATQESVASIPDTDAARNAEAAGGADSQPIDTESKANPAERIEIDRATAHDSVEAAPVEPSNVDHSNGTLDDGQKNLDERHASQDAAAQESVPSHFDRPSVMDDAKKGDSADDMAIETAVEDLKRKRRSASPTPKEEAVKRRRAEVAAEDAARELVAPAGPTYDNAAKPDVAVPEHVAPGSKDSGTADFVPADKAQDDLEAPSQDVGPAHHANTPAIYVNNLMRPMREVELREHLIALATPPGDEQNDNIIETFYVDSIRTHAFVIFASAPAAARVRNRLHGRVWPKESNRKALFVDFLPADKVNDWIRLEEGQSGKNKPGYRWEVVYEADRDGQNVEAVLRSTSITSSSAATHSAGRSTMPAVGVEGAPTGPRGYQGSSDQFGSATRPPPDAAGMREGRLDSSALRAQRPPDLADDDYEYTSAQPGLRFQAVPPAMAGRRLQSMRDFYTSETARQLGRDINRYSFQEEDRFVDRGKEVFEGIRPPHRQQAMDRQRGFDVGRGRGRGRGAGRPPRRGTAPFWSRGDRYVPGQGGPVEERPPRLDDDDRRPRY